MANIKNRDSKNRLIWIQQELDSIIGEVVELREERFVVHSRKIEVPIDIYESEDSIHIRAEVPGVERENLNLYLSRDLLVIAGSKSPPGLGDNVSFLNAEREFGKFTRDVGLTKPIDVSRIEAKLEGGILSIKLPKRSDRRGSRKKIRIE